VQALLESLVGRGLDPSICRLFIIDGAKALTKAIGRTFGSHTPIQRCQVHKARNITERLPKAMQASVRRTRQSWRSTGSPVRATCYRRMVEVHRCYLSDNRPLALDGNPGGYFLANTYRQHPPVHDEGGAIFLVVDRLSFKFTT